MKAAAQQTLVVAVTWGNKANKAREELSQVSGVAKAAEAQGQVGR